MAARKDALIRKAARDAHLRQMAQVLLTYPSVLVAAEAMGEVRSWLASCRPRWDAEELDWWMRATLQAAVSYGIAGLSSAVYLARTAAIEGGNRNTGLPSAGQRVSSLFASSSARHGALVAIARSQVAFGPLSATHLAKQDEIMRALRRLHDVDTVLVSAVRRAARDLASQSALTE